MPTPGHAEEVKALFDQRYSVSSKSSISAALSHWDVVCDRYLWPRIIRTGDPHRGAKLATFVLFLMGLPAMYPSSTIANYTWALCAFMQQELQADPRVNVIGWAFFATAVQVLCYMPTEPRKRVPTALIRASLAAVDESDFVQVQTALLVLFLYFTFQRSELPCPKTYDGLDPLKHLLVKHMQPFEGGTRWAVGATKADPRAERLSGDAGPGRAWRVIGDVSDGRFDMRRWLALFYGLLPPGPREPDSPYFVAHDLVRCLTYSVALGDFRSFLRRGGCADPESFGLHGVRSEAFVTCSGAVSDEVAVIQGGWASVATASRYDRLTAGVAASIAPKMVAFHSNTVELPHETELPTSQGDLHSAGGLGVVAARAAVRKSGVRQDTRPASSGAASGGPSGAHTTAFQPATLPAGWSRIWHPTSGRRSGYESYVGPRGQTARSIAEARRKAALPAPTPRSAAVSSAPPRSVPVGVSSLSHQFPDDLSDYLHFSQRPSSRPAPRERVIT